jgi:hypothetical protein
MAKTWLLVAALMWLAVPVCYGGVGQTGQPAGVGLGNSGQGPNLTHQPPFISNLLDTGLLTEDQVSTMLTAGFGGIRISGLLANQIAPLITVEDDQDPFQVALDGILTNRADGMGFGQIALSSGLNLGHILAGANK